jgi:PAS domain S-box-containing protein
MKSILLVGNSHIRDWMGDVPARHGYEVTVHADADAALAAQRAKAFPLVIIDADSLADHGLDLCRGLNALSTQGQGLVVLVGRREPLPDLPALFSAGAAAYMIHDEGTRRLEALLATTSRLCESEQRYQLIAEHASDVIWTMHTGGASKLTALTSVEAVLESVDPLMAHWRLDYVSPSVERFAGYSPQEAMTVPLSKLLTPHSYLAAKQAVAETLAHGLASAQGSLQLPTLELEYVRKDASHGWCELACTFVRDDQGRPYSALGIGRDISARKKAERALHQQETQLRSLVTNLPDMLITVARDGTIQFVNHGSSTTPVEAVTGVNAFDFVAPEYQAVCHDLLAQAFARREVQTIEALDMLGSWWACRLVPIAEEEEVQSVMVICTDINQQHIAADALHKEQQLLRQLLDLHERDRQLIAYEIHDGCAQHLTAALYGFEAYQRLQHQQPDQAQAAFETGLRMLRKCMAEARRMIGGLRPPILDELGVVAALDYLICEYHERGGPEIQFSHDLEFERLAPPLESAIFRILQESLSNACRHSQSKKIRVELFDREGRVYIDVRDWGIGFDSAEVQEGCFGLRGIRERVRLLGGQFSLTTAAGQGTHISVALPLVARMQE